jgi:hypothetical protein
LREGYVSETMHGHLQSPKREHATMRRHPVYLWVLLLGVQLVVSAAAADTLRLDYDGFVRHDVAYTAVMTPKGGHNLVCCHQYPTQTCGWSNPAV